MSTITIIEDFSNEILYEIFDYLYDNDIYKAFSILNYRFDQLLHCSFLQYKIQIDNSCIEENTMDELKKISHRIKNQILSISISTSTGILSLWNFDSSYGNLQRLILNSMKLDKIHLLLCKLTNLPQLYSLTIQIINQLIRFRTIYRLVFNLSKLKYFKLETYSKDFNIYRSLSIASHQQLTSIEHLIVDHPYSFEQLVHLLSSTRKVHHLKFIICDSNPINLTLLSRIQLTKNTAVFQKVLRTS